MFLNKYSSNTILSDKLVHTVVSDEINLGKALTTAIRHTQEIPNVIEQDMNLFCTLKKSPAKEDFLLLTKELLDIQFK